MLMLVVLALFAGAGSQSQRTIAVPVLVGRDRVTFDIGRFSEEDVRRWVKLSPNVSNSNGYLVPDPIPLCVDRYPEYRECGTRDWTAKNFVFNANVNLQKTRDRIRELDEPSYPRELLPVVHYLKTIQEDHLFFQGQLLKFVQDWEPEDLASSFDGIDPVHQCSEEIASVRTAPNKDAAYRLAYYKWWNCVNRALRSKVGKYPEADWKEFLRRYSIREELTDEDVD